MLVESKYHINQQQVLSEQECIRAAMANPEKFDVLYDKYYEPILQFVYKRVEGKEASYDITAQVFLTVMLKISKYKFTGVPFSAWLYQIAINEINQLYRKNRIQRTIKVEEAELVEMLHEMEESQEVQYQQMLSVLSEFPMADIQLIEMRFFEKRSFREIGEILNITENNSKVRVYRILEKLKKILQADK